MVVKEDFGRGVCRVGYRQQRCVEGSLRDQDLSSTL